MTPDISERVLEDTIEAALLHNDYHKRTAEQYDRSLCLLPQDVLDFVLATQPKEWNKLAQHHGSAVREQFLKRVAAEIERRGTLDVLRQGIKDSGCKFRLAYFQPASGLNEETQRLHGANLFAVVRQLRYSTRNENSLDLVLFLNGIPLFTAELKNPLSGQNVEDAIRQYKTTRDPREPLLAYGRCLGHFAVDSELAYVASQLAGPRTRFLPFNQGRFGGAGNPPVPPTRSGYATAYLWHEIWAPASVLDLVRQFIHEVEEEDDKGRKTGMRFLIFPRYQQLDAVRRLVADARSRGPGQRYLIQHSAGSGKSFTIAWLAHQLSTLHNVSDERVFDSIVVITDRRILDRQLQSTIRQFEQTLGVVETIDTTSRQLKDALESGKTIIVTTLQKFPFVLRGLLHAAGAERVENP
jgi:type I restriction enzyme R subunit